MLGAGEVVTTRHWLVEQGWLALVKDEGLQQVANLTARCVGSKSPQMDGGAVVIARCGRTVPMPTTWSIVQTSTFAPLFMLCWQHGHQHADFTALYERLRAGE
jgi:hypothetical protein